MRFIISVHLLSLAHYYSFLILTSSTTKLLDTCWAGLHCIDLYYLQLFALDILQIVYHSNIADFIINSNYIKQVTV